MLALLAVASRRERVKARLPTVHYDALARFMLVFFLSLAGDTVDFVAARFRLPRRVLERYTSAVTIPP